MTRVILFVFTAVAFLITPNIADACQVCFTDPNSPMTKGMQVGVWFMLGVIVAVEALFGIFFFVYLRRRAQHNQSQTLTSDSALTPQGVS